MLQKKNEMMCSKLESKIHDSKNIIVKLRGLVGNGVPLGMQAEMELCLQFFTTNFAPFFSDSLVKSEKARNLDFFNLEKEVDTKRVIMDKKVPDFFLKTLTTNALSVALSS